MPEYKVFGENIIIKADRVEEVNDKLLYQAVNEPEVFLIRDNKKCWIQDEVTYEKLGFKWGHPINKLPLADLNRKYQTGETILWKDGEFIVGNKPRDIYFPQEKMFDWVKGLLTLHAKPSADEALDLGFNLILPFANLVDDWQGKIIPSVGRFTNGDSRIVGHNISDEPDCRDDTAENVLASYDSIRKRDPNPIGCIFCGADIGCGIKPREYWMPVVNKLDFVMLNVYPYNIHTSDPMKEMERCFNEEWKGVTVPILPLLQAHGSEHQNHRKPDALEQVKFWKDRGFGYVVYCWKDEYSGVSEYRDEWKEANKYKP